MSVSVTRAEGVTVLTLNTDSSSICPPLCQILGGLCYNPVCCSRSRDLHRGQRTAVSQALLILSGLLTVGLAVILSLSHAYWWFMDPTAFPFWMGGLVRSSRSCSASRFSAFQVVLNVILQLSGVCFAIAAIVMFSINLADTNLWDFCNLDNFRLNYDYDDYGRRHARTTPSPSAQETALRDACLEAKRLSLMLLMGINGVLIVLSALQLCLCVSSSVMGVRALQSIRKTPSQVSRPPLLSPTPCRPPLLSPSETH
uniref:Transmembrane protein 176l.4 n=1 Tax=Salarias fasciatus TaxID=181472 RepID=A0A672HYS6_SALFA